MLKFSSASNCHVDVIACHAFSHDGKLVAIAPASDGEIHIFELNGETHKLASILPKHTARVLGLSFSITGKFVSISEDRLAYVWHQVGDTWEPVSVFLKATRAPSCVAFSPNGDRFAIGLSSQDTRSVRVCSFNPQFGFWTAKSIGNFKGTVSCLAWHPTSQYLAAGSIDKSCSIFDVNEAEEPPYGEVQVNEDAGAWVNAVAFSPSGRFLAFVSQDSAVRFKNLSKGPNSPSAVTHWRRLPFLTAIFVSEDLLVACGFNCVPVLIKHDNATESWNVLGSIDPSKNPRHTNTITQCKSLGSDRMSTSGLDGRVTIWEMNEVLS